MIWTKTKPTEPGHYWIKRPGHEATTCQIDHLGFVMVLHYDRWQALRGFKKDVLWAGPIEEPTP